MYVCMYVGGTMY